MLVPKLDTKNFKTLAVSGHGSSHKLKKIII